VLGAILLHDVDVRVPRNFLRDELHEILGAGEPLGHNQMSDQETLLRDSVLVHVEIPYLTVHLLEYFLQDLGVIRGIRKSFRRFFSPVLCIWHIDIDDPVQEFDYSEGFVPRAIVDQGKVQAKLDGLGKGSHDLWNVVGGSDEIDVVGAQFLEPHHIVRHLGEGGLLASPPVADVIILAEDAAEIAVGEKDGSRAMISHQRGFLAEMGKYA